MPEPEPQPELQPEAAPAANERSPSSSGSGAAAVSGNRNGAPPAGAAVDWWDVAARSARFVLCGGVPRSGDPDVDAQRRSLHSMRARKDYASNPFR